MGKNKDDLILTFALNYSRKHFFVDFRNVLVNLKKVKLVNIFFSLIFFLNLNIAIFCESFFLTRIWCIYFDINIVLLFYHNKKNKINHNRVEKKKKKKKKGGKKKKKKKKKK